jgi:hypothetical protein
VEAKMGIVAAVQEWWSDRRAARAYEALGPTERGALARDVGAPEDILERIISRGSKAGEELPRLLQALHLDPETLQRTRPDVMRDMQITCSGCTVAKQCRRDLRQDVSRLTFHHYCPNTETIASVDWRISWPDLIRFERRRSAHGVRLQ